MKKLSKIQLLHFEESDIEFILYGLSHPKIIPFYGIKCTSKDDAIAQLKWYRSQISDKKGEWRKLVYANKSIGAIGFNDYNRLEKKIEVGFWLLPEYWGKHFITTTFPAMLKLILARFDLREIFAQIESENVASKRLVSKLGFVHTKTSYAAEIKEGKSIDLELYILSV